MGTTYKPSASTGYKPRKATFTVDGKGAKRVFTPVNHRAHIVAKRRKQLTAAQLRATVGKGTYLFYAYNKADGKLKAIKV